MSLGPVEWNCLEAENVAAIKPHLIQRLRPWTETGLGTIGREADGKLSFVPSYIDDVQHVKPTAPYKEPAYVPFLGEHAYLDPNPGERVKITNIPTLSPETKNEFKPGDRVRLECTVKDLTDVGIPRKFAEEIVAGAVGELVTVSGSNASARFPDAWGQWHFSPKFLRRAEAKLDFDPMTSPIQVGDRVKRVKRGYINEGHTAVVTGFDEHGSMLVKWDRADSLPGAPWNMPRCRAFFEIVERAAAPEAKPDFDPMTEPLREGDIVEVAFDASRYIGRMGTVKRVFYGGGADVDLHGLRQTSWGSRSSLKLIERPNT